MGVWCGHSCPQPLAVVLTCSRIAFRPRADRSVRAEPPLFSPITFLPQISPTHGGCPPDAMNVQADSISAQHVVKAAHEELLQLMRQRAEIMKRIGTVKQTIAGLANLFGDQVLGDDLLELIDRKPNGRQPGFTKACRRVLMEVRRPLGAREVCAELERYAPAILARHKDPLASVTTVLNRLVDYGEA